MSKSNPYQPFSNFVLRTPLLPYSFYESITSKENISEEDFREVFSDDTIKEAIFLASPTLYFELEKWNNNQIKDNKSIEKLKFSFLKYISRMSSRCTPFGLFAGCSVGEFEENSDIQLNNSVENYRHTRLDMNYLVALSQDLIKNENIKNQILFYPNTSIYKSGNQVRYIEFEYLNGKRLHHIMGVEDSIYLQKVLDITKDGLLLKDIVALLIDEENSEDVVSQFVDDLIESQILINQLEPSVSGPEFLDHILQILSNINGTEDIVVILKSVQKRLQSIDRNFGNNPKEYIAISNELEKLNTNFNIKYLFQTDLILNPKKNILNKSIVDSVKECIAFFNKITIPQKNTLINNFRDAFRERYEQREIKLSFALDVEKGIGYKQDQNFLDINPLIDDIWLPASNADDYKEIRRSQADIIFQNKLINALINGDTVITIKDEDINSLNESWDDLPNTMSTIIEVLKIDGIEKIKFSSIGGSSGANLLSRFCHGDKKLKDHTQNIINIEERSAGKEILAEIVHLPEARVGNILMRPLFRKYEIPYLARSVVPTDHQLEIQDLTISVKNNSVILKSQKHNKEVIPHLTNAHNFSSNALPIYQFLCDMQTQNKRAYIGINLGSFVNEYDFIPRIEYKDIIICEASWNLKKSEIQSLLINKDEDEKLNIELDILLKKRKLPKLVTLVDGDNELLVNLSNLTSVRMLLEAIKNRPNFRLTEFLFGEDGIVKTQDKKQYYANQIILSFYNNAKLDDRK